MINPQSEIGYGEQNGQAMAVVNLRCLEGVEPAQLPITQVDGKSF